LKFIYKP